ncbi:hypothetical protein ACIQXR_14865 [Peribacillus sp. NPDC097224]|uniref:hypothetical protein n=2 Tax=Peribacillus TaxID=2675229 RepID=UPI00381DD2D2
MHRCKRVMIGWLMIGSLVACEEPAIQEGKFQVQETKEGKDLVETSDVPSYKTPKYFGSQLYNYWISNDTYLIIMRDEISTYTLQRITKNEIDPLRHFEIVNPTGSTITGILYNEENRNRTTLFTLKLSEDKRKLTITMPNEKPITYKETDLEPNEFNPRFIWEDIKFE